MRLELFGAFEYGIAPLMSVYEKEQMSVFHLFLPLINYFVFNYRHFSFLSVTSASASS